MKLVRKHQRFAVQSVLCVLIFVFFLTPFCAFALVIPSHTLIENQAPSFTAGPSDGGSSATTPTTAGNNVTFTATATDPNIEQYYLAICKTNSITPGSGGAPTCAPSQTWAISGAYAGDGSHPATVTYTTSSGSAESNVWYAFVCDNASTGACSSSSQGTGDNGSPYIVNHAPTFGTLLVGSATGGTGTINPGSTVYFHLNANGGANGIDDNDSDTTQDTVRVYICDSATTGMTTPGTCIGGSLICSQSTPFDPNTVPFECSNAPIVDIPQASGTYHFKTFVFDSHDLAGTGTSDQTFDVANVPPVAASYSVTDITLSVGVSTEKTYTATITDDNGGDTLTGATAVLYEDDTVDLSDGTCNSGSINEKNCYPGIICSPGTPSGITLVYTCAWTGSNAIWFNANANTNWRMHANPTDGTNSPTGLTDSNAILVEPLRAIGTVNSVVDYSPSSSLAPGADSSVRTLTLTNQGNLAFDIQMHGTAMASTNDSIDAGQQKFHETSNTFGWADTPDAAGPYALLTSSGVGGETNGCLNRDLAVRAAHDVGTENESVYMRLRVPSPKHSGSYSGSLTITAVSTTSCTGTSY